jgi:hypothetical protein
MRDAPVPRRRPGSPAGDASAHPIFEGGRLKATLALRQDQQKEAAVIYQRTVLNAWHEIDDSLTAYEAEERPEGAWRCPGVHRPTASQIADNANSKRNCPAFTSSLSLGPRFAAPNLVKALQWRSRSLRC